MHFRQYNSKHLWIQPLVYPSITFKLIPTFFNYVAPVLFMQVLQALTPPCGRHTFIITTLYLWIGNHLAIALCVHTSLYSFLWINECVSMRTFAVNISEFEVHLTKSKVRNFYLSLVVDLHSISMLELNVRPTLVIFEGYT